MHLRNVLSLKLSSLKNLTTPARLQTGLEAGAGAAFVPLPVSRFTPILSYKRHFKPKNLPVFCQRVTLTSHLMYLAYTGPEAGEPAGGRRRICEGR